MKVSELIKKLSKRDPDENVFDCIEELLSKKGDFPVILDIDYSDYLEILSKQKDNKIK